MKKQRALIVSMLLGVWAVPARADDWPQWRGPNRDNVSKETGLLQEWPEGGPKLLWTYKDAGNSYSAFAIVGDRVYSMGADDTQEFVFALDAKTGKELWKTKFARRFTNGYGDGPRATPTIDGEFLYALGGQGELVCLKTSNGEKAWSVNLQRDLGGRMMSGWGYSESVLIDGDALICSPGDKRGTLASLDKKSGKVNWRSTDLTDRAAYSSVRITTIGDVKQYVQQTNSGVAGIRAKDGKLLWKHNKPYRTAVVPTPVIKDDFVYVTAGYGVGCTLLKLSPDGSGGTNAQEVYANRVLVNKHGGALLLDGHVYGHQDGRTWVCQNFKTGEQAWSARDPLRTNRGSGALTFADGRLYLLSDGGGVGLLNPTPEGWDLKGKFDLPQQSEIRSRRGAVWSHPVVANGRLYLRDQELVFCYDVKAEK